MAATELLNLTHIVSEAAQSIDQFINKHGDCLSFNPQAPDLPPLSPETAALHKARITLCDAASNLIDLTLTPRESVVSRCFNVHTASALRIAYRFKLAHAVPLDGSATYDVVAQRVGLPATAVERVIAVLISSHFFRLTPNGISHTRLSHLLASDERFEAFLGLCFEDAFVGSAHLADALERWGASAEPNETGWNIANVTQNTFYQHLESDTSSSEQLVKALGFMSSSSLCRLKGVGETFDWSGVGDALVVDVGGSQGCTSITLAKQFPRLHFIVQDAAQVCKQGEEALIPELRDRIRFQAHDIFQPQEGIAGKTVIYLLRAVLHNWHDKYACRILQAIVPAMKPGDRIILCEQIIPEPGIGGVFLERFARASDFQMWATFNGQERTVAQFKALAEMAHPNLKILEVYAPGWVGMSTIVLALNP